MEMFLLHLAEEEMDGLQPWTHFAQKETFIAKDAPLIRHMWVGLKSLFHMTPKKKHVWQKF